MVSWLVPLLLLAPCVTEMDVCPEEAAEAARWATERLGATNTATGPSAPFSFVYGGRDSASLLGGWRCDRTVRQLDGVRTEHTLTYADPRSGLRVRCVAVLYRDFPTVEWTVFFRNAGPADTPILSDLRAIDVVWRRPPEGEFVLHHHVGSPCTPADYRPLQTVLRAGAEKRFAAAGGRPTNSDLPYFNIAWPGGGVIFVVGWPGQWAARFARDSAQSLFCQAGQELTHLKLHPGEEVRTPLVVLQFWKGDRLRAQNLWRRWMIAHNVPRPGGQSFTTHFASTSGDLSDAAREIRLLDGWTRHRLPLDYWIMDANWYPNGGSWMHTGTWEPDPIRFPHGLREVNDAAHAQGTKTVVWFEPERVWPGSWLWEKRPEWLLSCPKESEQTPELGHFANRLLDLGNPEARQWLLDHVDRMITQEKIDVYRQDFNINPLAYWRASDPPDREGITEHNYVIGYLAWWDELLRRHPNIWIDTCASGGRRNDLETLRRAVPLLRSDYFQTPLAQQCQTLGISLWIPFYGSGTGLADDYMIRSSFCPLFRIGLGAPPAENAWGRIAQHVQQFRSIALSLEGDFYPLTPYHLEKDDWVAWQFDRPDLGQGVVQAFRREECPGETIRLRLRGLDAVARYAITDLDHPTTSTALGAELMAQGMGVSAPVRPSALLFTYRRQP